jgi:phage gp36-like protein
MAIHEFTAYADPDDLKDIGLTDQFFIGDMSPNGPAVLKALVNAAAYIDSIIAVNPHITLPLAKPYDPNLIRCNASIAAWTLVNRRGMDPENESMKCLHQLRDDDVKWLDRIANGRAVLQRQITKDQPQGVQPMMTSNQDRGLRAWSGRVGSGGR